MKPSRLSCEETFLRLDDYLDRRLDETERTEVELHLATCEVCAREYQFESRVIAEVKSKLGRVDVPAGLAERVAKRLAGA
ncbi:MAG: zf-HC2 domain-containing protein [Thermoanaerobaculia bacterium]|nr:zf-HC2 domain-containing protein [Thermoanaerobaculia bacterium]